MAIRILPLFLILILASASSHSQVRSHIDSLENLLDAATDQEKVDLFCELSESYWQLSYDTSLLMAIHANNLALELDQPELSANSLYMIGNAYYLMGDFTNSMDYYLQALEIRKELGDSSSMASSYNNIGAVFLHMEDEESALEYFRKAGDIFSVLGDNAQLFAIFNNIGAVYVDQQILDRALEYFTRAYNTALVSGNRVHQSIALTNMGETTLAMGMYQQSEDYQLNAYDISNELGDMGMMATIKLNLGKLYLQRKQYEEALSSFQESLILARDINSLPIMKENYQSLTEYYDLRGEHEKALRLYKMYSAVKDSIVSEEGLMQIKELELKFNAQALQQEIEILRKDNEIQSLKGNRLKYIIISLAVILLALILLFVLYSQRTRFKREKTLILEVKNRELKKANEKLVESEKHLKELNSTKDKFFSIIGHDLRNPLNALLGFSELISGNSREYSREEVQKYSKIINEAAKNIHLLIENLLEWSRSQSGNIEFNPRAGDLEPIVTEIVRIFEAQAEKKSIALKTDIPEGIQVYADRNLLSTVLRNLINNAVKFTPRKGKVQVSASSKAGEGVIITVKDTGIGMDKEQLDNLFQLVHGPSKVGTAEEKGTGLGLILCKEFIDKHKGSIWAESEPGKGSLFRVLLPHKE